MLCTFVYVEQFVIFLVDNVFVKAENFHLLFFFHVTFIAFLVNLLFFDRSKVTYFSYYNITLNNTERWHYIMSHFKTC
jgi:hypothetical protein